MSILERIDSPENLKDIDIDELEELVMYLRQQDRLISIETNGTHELMWRGGMVNHIVDYKLTASGMRGYMDYEIYKYLAPSDFVKFVVGNRLDFAEATHVRGDLKGLGCLARFAFSPASETKHYKALHPKLLLIWMDKEELCDSVLNVQLHKMLGLVEDKVT